MKAPHQFLALALSAALATPLFPADDKSVNPKIQEMIGQVSEARIRAILEKLEAFGTRPAGAPAGPGTDPAPGGGGAGGAGGGFPTLTPADYEKNANLPAPGVCDDGSGTANVMELARVMSQYQFDKTLVFVAFAGEE